MIHPRSLGGQVLGGSMLGIGHAIGQNWVYDQHYGVPLAQAVLSQQAADDSRRAAERCSGRRVELPDPETPVGARGIGEPPVGAGYGAVLNAIADAVGDEVFRRAPVTPDIDSRRARRRRQADARAADGPHLEMRIADLRRIVDRFRRLSTQPSAIR